MKSNFHKDNTRNDGLYNQCKVCRQDYYLDKQDRIKQYYLDNRDRIKEYQLKNYEKIITQQRENKNNRKTKSSSTIDILGMDIDLYRKWIKFQMTPEMNWSNIEIDHVKAVCMFDLSKDEELKKAFSWQNTQPLLKKDHQLKGTKFNFLDYQLQFIKAYQFIKLNEEKFNENLH